MFMDTKNFQGVTYIWNNTDGLMGEDVSYIICRTMISIPQKSPQIGKITNIIGQNISQRLTKNFHSKLVDGNVFVELTYKPLKGEEEKLCFTIPYRGLIFSERTGEVIPDVKFIHARQVGLRSSLIEVVVALTASGSLPFRENKAYQGKFTNKTVFSVDDNLPEISEPLAAQIRLNILEHHFDGSLMRISGLKETWLMYVGKKVMREKVILTRQLEPFTEAIQLDEKIKDIGSVIVLNENLSINLINSRNTIIEGNFALKIEQPLFPFGVLDNEKNEAENVIEEIMKLQLKMKQETKNNETLKEAIEETAEENAEIIEKIEEENKQNDFVLTKEPTIEVVSKKEDIREQKNVEENISEIKNLEEVMIRQSRREKLTKYMRKLDRGITNKNDTKVTYTSNAKEATKN